MATRPMAITAEHLQSGMTLVLDPGTNTSHTKIRPFFGDKPGDPIHIRYADGTPHRALHRGDVVQILAEDVTGADLIPGDVIRHPWGWKRHGVWTGADDTPVTRALIDWSV